MYYRCMALNFPETRVQTTVTSKIVGYIYRRKTRAKNFSAREGVSLKLLTFEHAAEKWKTM